MNEETRTEEETPVGIEDLKSAAARLLDVAAKQLVTRRGFASAVVIINGDRSLDVSPLPGYMFGSPEAKMGLVQILKGMCKTTGAAGVILISDSWSLERTEEQLAMTNDEKFIEIANHGGNAACAAAGYGTLMEAIHIMGQTKDCLYTIEQKYQRYTKDGLIPGTAVHAGDIPKEHSIRLYGEPFETSTVPGATPNTTQVMGRAMSILYEGGE